MKKSMTTSLILMMVSGLLLVRCCVFPVTGIDPELKPYVDSFFDEAEKRGHHNLRPDVLNVGFQDISGSAQGRTIYLTNTIIIDPKSPGWEYNPEALVYHELGHLILKRDHLNTVHNKYCLSIMSSQDDPVYDLHEGEKLYNRRQYYLDELFKPGIPTPDWMN